YAPGNILVATTVTDAQGRYVFGVPAGTYEIRIDASTLPPGLAANQTFDLDATLDHRTQVTVSAGEEMDSADFGYNWAPIPDVTGNSNIGSIGDRLWIDADSDGVQD